MSILVLIEIILSVILTILILLQQREAGLSASIAGSGAESVAFERRGPAKTLHTITVTVAVLFLLVALALYFVA